MNLYSSGMPVIGFGSETKVERNMPSGELVMVILMVSSISVEMLVYMIGESTSAYLK
jgi:hypothetical protein